MSGLLREAGRPSGKSATRSPTQGATGSNTKGYVSDRATGVVKKGNDTIRLTFQKCSSAGVPPWTRRSLGKQYASSRALMK